jgi:hypothetical protein
MERRRLIQFSLRTLLLFVSLVCVYAAFRTDWTPRDRYAQSGTFQLASTDQHAVARHLKESVRRLPGHIVVDTPLFEFEKRFNGLAHDDMQKAQEVNMLFCRVQLSDGSESYVGFWIYPHRSTGPKGTDVTTVVCGSEWFRDVQSGAAARREAERSRLRVQTYQPILRNLQEKLDNCACTQTD